MRFVLSQTACARAHEHDREGCSFHVAWTINPHMKVGRVNPVRAQLQHARFVSALRAAGARVTLLPFVHGAFDSVFMKDSAILTARDGELHALPATVRHTERAIEPGVRSAQLASRRFACAAPLRTHLEGGDVVVAAHRRIALLGHGVRSAEASAAGLAHFLDCDVIPLALRDPALFHLDTALAVLSDDTLLLCEDAFTPASLRELARLRFRRVIRVPAAEAMRFALNFVEVGDTIVTGTASTVMDSVWRALGRTCVVAPLDEFQLAGGSAACLVARVHEIPAAAAAAAVAA